MPRHTSFLGDNAAAARVFVDLLPQRFFIVFFEKKDEDDDFILFGIYLFLHLYQKRTLFQLERTFFWCRNKFQILYLSIRISISISWRKHPWNKSHPMSFPLWSNDIAKHRQTSEGFAQGAEHGETYRNRRSFLSWVKILSGNSKYTRQMVEKDMLSKKQPDVFHCNLVAFLTKQTCFDIKLLEIDVDVNKLIFSFVCQGSKLYLFLVTWRTLRSAYGIHVFLFFVVCFSRELLKSSDISWSFFEASYFLKPLIFCCLVSIKINWLKFGCWKAWLKKL